MGSAKCPVYPEVCVDETVTGTWLLKGWRFVNDIEIDSWGESMLEAQHEGQVLQWMESLKGVNSAYMTEVGSFLYSWAWGSFHSCGKRLHFVM